MLVAVSLPLRQKHPACLPLRAGNLPDTGMGAIGLPATLVLETTGAPPCKDDRAGNRRITVSGAGAGDCVQVMQCAFGRPV